jgi:hypothetical protein
MHLRALVVGGVLVTLFFAAAYAPVEWPAPQELAASAVDTRKLTNDDVLLPSVLDAPASLTITIPRRGGTPVSRARHLANRTSRP